MPSELIVRATHQGDMRIDATTGEYTVKMDYPMGGHECSAFTPLQLLLASLAGCGGNTIALLLRRHDGVSVSGIEVTARAARRDEHPTVLTDIKLDFVVRGTGLDDALLDRCLTIADEQLCPVWAMLKPGTPITATITAVADEASGVAVAPAGA